MLPACPPVFDNLLTRLSPTYSLYIHNEKPRDGAPAMCRSGYFFSPPRRQTRLKSAGSTGVIESRVPFWTTTIP
jgi:hypothetical protein